MRLTEIVQQAYGAFEEANIEKLASLMSGFNVGGLTESLLNGNPFSSSNESFII